MGPILCVLPLSSILCGLISLGFSAPLAAHTQSSAIHSTDKELVAYIPVRPNVMAGDFQVLYSIGPLSIEAGQLVDFRLQAEITNNCGNNIGLGRYIVRADAASATTGVIVNKAVMSNITNDEHHEVIVHSGFDRLRASVEAAYYNVIVYAASSKPACNGIASGEENRLKVEGFGAHGFGVFMLEVR